MINICVVVHESYIWDVLIRKTGPRSSLQNTNGGGAYSSYDAVMTRNSSQGVQATVNSFRILEQLVEAEGSLGVTEIADAVGLSKGVVYTHLKTLIDLGYARKHEQRYLSSFGIIEIAEDIRHSIPKFTRVRHNVENLARVTGEVATLFVEEDGLGICVYASMGSEPWLPDYTCGSRMPLHVNAPGKAILSSFNRDRVDSIIEEHGLSRLTDDTLTIPETLDSELRTIRESGVSFCRGEQFSDVVGVATAVGLGERAPAAAIGVCGPSDQLSGRYLEEDITGQVISTAKTVQIDLAK
jgi:DNA-binding IclR family transcriptional regulator